MKNGRNRVFAHLITAAVAVGLTACTLPYASGLYGVDAVGQGAPPQGGQNGLPPRPQDGKYNGGSVGPAPVGYIQFQLPIVPIRFTLDSNGKFSAGTGGQIVTPFGAIRVGVNVPVNGRVDGNQERDTIRGKNNEPLPPKSTDFTDLLICHEGPPPQPCDGHTIRTGRKVRAEISGRSTLKFERDRIVVIVPKDVTVVVEDDGAPSNTGTPGPARVDIEEFKFWELGEDTEVDLERSRGGTKPDIAYNHMTGRLSLMPDVKISRMKKNDGSFTADDLPGEQDCATANDWKSEFSLDDFSDHALIACIRTVERDLGYIVVGKGEKKKPDSYRMYTYTWVR